MWPGPYSLFRFLEFIFWIVFDAGFIFLKMSPDFGYVVVFYDLNIFVALNVLFYCGSSISAITILLFLLLLLFSKLGTGKEFIVLEGEFVLY